MTTPLPKRDERSAPKFDPKNEALLPNFFEEFERTAKAAGIDEDATQMKKAVMGYLDVKTLLFWQTMDTYSDPLSSWDDFKKEVLDFYPGALSRAEVTTEELLQVVGTYQKKGITSISTLNKFHREFTVVAKALMDQGTLPDIQVAKHYVSVLPDHIRAEINSALRTYFPERKPGKAYTLNQLRQGATNLLSDTSAPVDMGNFRVGDLPKVPGPAIDYPGAVKSESKPEEGAPWLQQIAALTQVVNDLKKEVLANATTTREGRSARPAKPWIDTGTHSAYTLHGYQGPAMLSTAAAYALQSDDDPSEAAVVRDLIFKMETQRTAKDRGEATNSSTSTQSKPSLDATKESSTDPEPSAAIPQRIVAPAKQPKPVIGKLPETYVPPQEQNLGAPPKDDGRNYKYRAPIETEAAVDRVVEIGLQSMVSIRQDDLLAIAPEYRRKVKEAVTSWRIGVDGALLEDAGFLEGVYMLESSPFRAPNIPISVLFNDYGTAEEGDEYFVAKDTLSIRGVNATIGERAAHCILDSGCSLVVASLAACNAFGFAFDADKKIVMQSANGNTNWSIGLARDVPFRFGEVIAFLQVQIVDTPAYDFLLGRPFEVLMQATYRNFHSGDQHITLVDPNTEKSITIATLPREPPRFKMEDRREIRK
ncbi:hypothetical protein C8R42DRAFT_647007 [Lentinula raphanica]|nr:hypothetical protein C8R42DRAFT_647007 [Lentinula raphanica]